MFNKTVVVKDISDHSTKIDQRDNRISLLKTMPDSFFVCVSINSEAFKRLMGQEPYLSESHTEYGEPYQTFDYSRSWKQKVYEVYTVGVSVLQMQTNDRYAYFECVKRECQPLKVFTGKTVFCKAPKEEK